MASCAKFEAPLAALVLPTLTFSKTPQQARATDARAPSFHSLWRRITYTCPSLYETQNPDHLPVFISPLPRLQLVMSTRITFAPPPWVTALLLRPPPPAPPQPRTPPSAMRDLVAQWLVCVTDDKPSPARRPPHVIARFRGWLAFVFRLPAFVRRRKQSVPEPPHLPTAQFSLIERSLYFSSSIKEQTPPKPLEPPTKVEKKKPKKQRSKIVDPVPLEAPKIELSPLYKSLYFSLADRDDHEQSPPLRCESPSTPDDIRDRHCVQSFFLTDASAEGKGILEGLKEIKAQSAEPQRKRGWVPAVVSIILIALNPLK